MLLFIIGREHHGLCWTSSWQLGRSGTGCLRSVGRMVGQRFDCVVVNQLDKNTYFVFTCDFPQNLSLSVSSLPQSMNHKRLFLLFLGFVCLFFL